MLQSEHELLDLDSRFTKVKRRAAKTGDRKETATEDARWKHATKVHPGYPEGSQDMAALPEYSHRLKESGQTLRSPSVGSGPPKPTRPELLSSEQSPEDSMVVTGSMARGKRPFSTSAITGTSQLPDIGGIKNLSLNQEHGVMDRDALSVRTGLSTTLNTLNFRKRPFGTDFPLTETPSNDRFTHELPNPRRSKARSSGNIHTSRQAVVDIDPDYDRSAPVIGDVKFVRPVTGSKPKLFDPGTDNLTTSFVRDTPVGFASASHVHDSRAHVFRSKKEAAPREDDPRSEDQLLNRKQWQSNAPIRPFASKHAPVQSPPTVDPHKRHRTHEGPTGLLNIPAQPERDPELVLQPETRPISQEQLVAEVKGIYAGLVMVEARCVEVDNKQALAARDPATGQQPKLSNEQWQALIALHRTLLHEHHDFFLASQHPSASPALRRLAAKYNMPARMWRHGIHSFLELLRHRLPDSLDRMLMFIYLAYSMMALLYETVPTFEDTWIECLGDLGRYRMAIEDDDIRDREVWTGVSRFWYSKAADKSPSVGRLYHHLAILARPNALQQLFYYAKSLTCIHPFLSARESILTLFGGPDSSYNRSLSSDTLLIKIHGMLFSRTSLESFHDAVGQLLPSLDTHIGRVTAKWKEQGVYIAVTNFAALFEYGLADAIFTQAFAKAKRTAGSEESMTEESQQTLQMPTKNQIPADIDTASGSLMVSHASYLTFSILKLALQRPGDPNILPHAHVSLVFLLSLSTVYVAMSYIEKDVPWSEIASFLNRLAITSKVEIRSEDKGFPQPKKGVGRPLPEDFAIHGQIWSQGYFPNGWFENAMVDDEERSLELPSMAEPRVERILWLGARIASHDRWLHFDPGSKTFSNTPYAPEMATAEHMRGTASSGESRGAIRKESSTENLTLHMM